MNAPDPENDSSMNEIDRDSVAARAYEKWESTGRPDGRAEEHWYDAERELREHHHGATSRDNRHSDEEPRSAGRHGPTPRSSGRSDRSTRPRSPGLHEATSGGEDIPTPPAS